MKTFLLAATWWAVSVALGFTAIFTWLWWLARATDWETCVTFNKYNEALLEGVMFHVLLVALSALSIWNWRRI